MPEMEHIVMGSGSSFPFCRHHGSCSKRARSWVHPLNDRIQVTCENYPGGSDIRGKDEPEVLQDEKLQGLGQHRGSTSNIALQAPVVDLEHQVMLAHNENMDIKRAITRLYTLGEATHTEVKTHNKNLEDRVNALTAAMPLNPLMKPLLEAPSNSTGNLGKKMENFGSTLVDSGIFFGLSSAKECSVEKFEELSPLDKLLSFPVSLDTKQGL